MEFKDWFIYGMIIGLFVISAISFSTLWSQENNAAVNINQVQGISSVSNSINANLNTSNAKSESQRTAFQQETSQNPQISTLGFVFNSILSALNLFGDMGLGIFYAIFAFGQQLFGISPVITDTIMAVIVGLIVLAVWSVVRAGR